MKVANVNSLTEFPANALIITYSDHYRGNSGDDIFFTDNEGQLDNREIYFQHWNDDMDDRGIISIKALTHEKGAFVLYKEFRDICSEYVNASNNLKDWEAGKSVYNIDNTEEQYKNNGYGTTKNFFGSKITMKFEDSYWFRKISKRCKSETIQKKKIAFNEEKIEFNNSILNTLKQNKLEAAKWFNDNEISVRNAYLFYKGSIK